jgi:ubiquinol-cytochrome c reductase cytochrome b subunit
MNTQTKPEPPAHPSLGTQVVNWVDERTGIHTLLHESLDEPIPGGAGWAYVFGSGLLFLFVSQIITGICLALYYVPSADHAHTVVSYIVKEVTAGSFIRSIHAYGSSGIIILLLLHIGQTILYGSYKGRRELLWLSGCILLALMLGMAFTGYLLPWDEKAYFASAVGTNLIAEVPFIGPPLQLLVRGGEQMGTLTISRFYVLHVFVLPAALIGFIAAHVFFFRKAGAAGPIKEDPVHPKLPAVPFYPRQVVIDAMFAVVLIGILAIIAIRMPMDLGPAANPADTSFLPRPEWYYRPAFQWLKYLSGHASLLGGIVLPAVLALVFAALPFLDRRLERRPWRRPIVVGAFLLFLVGYTSLGVASYHDDYTDPGVAAQMRKQDADAKAFMEKPFVPESSAGSASAALASADPKVLKGLAIFQAQSCSSCHGDGGVGTAAAGPLTAAGAKFTDARLAALLHAPNSRMTSGGMTPVDLKPDDLEALIAYLRQLH